MVEVKRQESSVVEEVRHVANFFSVSGTDHGTDSTTSSSPRTAHEQRFSATCHMPAKANSNNIKEPCVGRSNESRHHK